MSRLLSGLLACSLLLAFSGEADAQRQLQRGDAPAARCSECGAHAMDRQRAGRTVERQVVRRRVSLRSDRAPFAAMQREDTGGRRGDARGGEGRGRRGEARGGEGRGRRGEAGGGEGRGRRGEAGGGEGRGRDSERARKQREKLREKADTNGDGVIDQAERDALRKKIQERRQRGGQGRG